MPNRNACIWVTWIITFSILILRNIIIIIIIAVSIQICSCVWVKPSMSSDYDVSTNTSPIVNWNDEMELISVSLRQGSLWIEIIFKPNWFLPCNNLRVAQAGRTQVYLLAGYYPPSWCHNLPPAPLDIVPPPPLWCYNASLAWPLGGGRIGPIRARYGSTALSAGHTHHPPLLPLLAPATALSAAI